MKVIAVVPAWNEEPRVRKTIEAVRQYADGVVVVDDGSADRTSDEAHVGDAIVLRHVLNRGQGASL
ncbi:MAG: glycosyltransferase, partial [Candidatus Shapirobacteria bacterium]